MLMFVSLSPGEAQVHITVGNSLMLGYKGHKCFLSPLRLGVRLTYTGGSNKSLQPKGAFGVFFLRESCRPVSPFCVGSAAFFVQL